MVHTLGLLILSLVGLQVQGGQEEVDMDIYDRGESVAITRREASAGCSRINRCITRLDYCIDMYGWTITAVNGLRKVLGRRICFSETFRIDQYTWDGVHKREVQEH